MLEPFWIYFNSVRVTVLDGCYSHEANWNCISGYSGFFFLLTGCCQSFDNDGAGGRKETEMVVKLTAASIMAIFNP